MFYVWPLGNFLKRKDYVPPASSSLLLECKCDHCNSRILDPQGTTFEVEAAHSRATQQSGWVSNDTSTGLPISEIFFWKDLSIYLSSQTDWLVFLNCHRTFLNQHGVVQRYIFYFYISGSYSINLFIFPHQLRKHITIYISPQEKERRTFPSLSAFYCLPFPHLPSMLGLSRIYFWTAFVMGCFLKFFFLLNFLSKYYTENA